MFVDLFVPLCCDLDRHPGTQTPRDVICVCVFNRCFKSFAQACTRVRACDAAYAPLSASEAKLKRFVCFSVPSILRRRGGHPNMVAPLNFDFELSINSLEVLPMFLCAKGKVHYGGSGDYGPP